MASFNGNIGTPSGGFNLKVEYSISQSITGNYSDVTATGYVKRNNSSYVPHNDESSSAISIDGGLKGYSGGYDLRSDGYKAIVSHSKRVYHNADGTKSINISFSFNGKLSSYYPNGSISKTITLPTIPRASTINSFNISNNDIEGIITCGVTKKVNSYTDKLRISIPNVVALETFENYTSGQEVTFNQETIDYLYEYTKNTANGQVTLGAVIETYSGNTKIGESAELTLKAYIKDDLPIFNNFMFEDVNQTTVNLTGNNQNFIKGYSNAKLTIPLENKAEALKGATITKYVGAIGSKQVNIPYSDEDDVSDVINGIENNQIVVYAEDSRKNVSSSIIKYPESYIDYSKPVVLNATIDRQDNGISEHATINFNGTWFNDNFGDADNTLSCKLFYKEHGDDTWIESTNPTLIIDGNNFSYEGEMSGDLGANGFDLGKAFDIKIQVYDLLALTEKETEPLPNGTPNIAIHKDGVSFGSIYDVDEGGVMQIRGKKLENNSIYSTEEQVIGTWEDGKKLYRKSIEIGSLPNNTTINIEHGIENLERFTSKSVSWFDTVDNRWIFDFRKDSYTISIEFTANDTAVYISGIGTDWSTRTRDCIITLEYTKNIVPY